MNENNKKETDFSCFTTESVSEGHPDKLADQIAEIVLDYCIEKDSNAHVGCEVLITGQKIVIGGEIKSNVIKIDSSFEEKIKEKIDHFLKQEIKYCEKSWNGINNLKYDFLIVNQSKEIDHLASKGAGDNCSVFGYAENNDQFFPKFQTLANLILKNINDQRKNDLELQQKYSFAPDGKIQILYKENRVVKIVLCQQFLPEKKDFFDQEEHLKDIKITIRNKIIKPLIKKLSLKNDFEFRLQPFFKGGPSADCGLTGRKLMVDNYGSFCFHGGGNFSGKDCTKTDRTLALFARFVAKHLVASKLCEKIIIQISSSIGCNKLLNITVLKKESIIEHKNLEIINQVIKEIFTLTLEEIIDKLKLKNQKFFPFAKYGYFGKKSLEVPTPWEELSSLKDIESFILKNKFKF